MMSSLCFNLFEYILRCFIVFTVEPDQVRQELKQQRSKFFLMPRLGFEQI